MKSERPEDSLHPSLGAALRRDDAKGQCRHPDPVLLAEYLEGSLDEDTRDELEGHLSVCPSCRRLAMESAAIVHGGGVLQVPGTDLGVDALAKKQVPGTDLDSALDDRPQVPGTYRRPYRRSRWPMAVAAGLAALSAGLWWRPAVPPSPQDAVHTTTPSPASADADPASTGPRGVALPPIAAFDSILDLGGRPVLRHGSSPRAPQPLAPRWTLISEVRPTFVWWPGTVVEAETSGSHDAVSVGETALERFELLLVDAEESVVAKLPIQALSTGPSTLAWPAALPDLEIGKLYAWKVNAWRDGEQVASDYVPFQVATKPETAQPSEGGEPSLELRQARQLADAGHLEAALMTLGKLASPAERDAAEPLLEAIFAAQRLPPSLSLEQRRRLGWPSSPSDGGAPPP